MAQAGDILPRVPLVQQVSVPTWSHPRLNIALSAAGGARTSLGPCLRWVHRAASIHELMELLIQLEVSLGKGIPVPLESSKFQCSRSAPWQLLPSPWF